MKKRVFMSILPGLISFMILLIMTLPVARIAGTNDEPLPWVVLGIEIFGCSFLVWGIYWKAKETSQGMERMLKERSAFWEALKRRPQRVWLVEDLPLELEVEPIFMASRGFNSILVICQNCEGLIKPVEIELSKEEMDPNNPNFLNSFFADYATHKQG